MDYFCDVRILERSWGFADTVCYCNGKLSFGSRRGGNQGGGIGLFGDARYYPSQGKSSPSSSDAGFHSPLHGLASQLPTGTVRVDL